MGNVYDFVDNLTPTVNAEGKLSFHPSISFLVIVLIFAVLFYRLYVFHLTGEYSTYIFAERAITLINAQAAAGADAPPMFLYLAFQNIHWPLEVCIYVFNYFWSMQCAL